jgi:AcrR family transcriptional regulator
MSRGSGEATRRRIVEAALTVLKQEGFAGATSRAIARIGGFNQALIFYHFGSLDQLLLAALDQTTADRLGRYRQAVAGADTLPALLAVARRLYAEDRAGGHITVVSQMVAGSIGRSELAPAVLERMEPWVDLSEDALAKVLAPLGLAELVPIRDLAQAVVTFYLGANLLTHLDPKGSATVRLLRRLEELVPVLFALPRAAE